MIEQTWILMVLASLWTSGDVPPSPQQESVVVTASRQRERVVDSTAYADALDARVLDESPALALDDKLRQVPGFSTFRRSGSLASHPTTQGVSLRGIGPSGASRSLVLFDGIPLNDPFGGWVYWNRIPASALEQVEVIRGGGSALYGSTASGGTIQLLTRDPTASEVQAGLEFGGRGTVSADGALSLRTGDWSLLLAGSLLDTDGYFVIDKAERGAVDRPVRVDYRAFFARASRGKLHLVANFYDEDRGNGTVQQTNASRMALASVGWRSASWDWDFFLQDGSLASVFTRIAADRSQETVTARQRFDSLGLGSSFTARPSSRWSVGADWRSVRWDKQSQDRIGTFVQYAAPLSEGAELQAGVRFDSWNNRSREFEASPRVGIRVAAGRRATLRASAYRGFRAPTLNELYRPFRVGNATTLANDALTSESLWGTEGGIDFYPGGNTLLRLNVFLNLLDDPVGNATLQTSPSEILRQRVNLGRVKVRGLEAEALRRFGNWELEASYLLSDTRVDETGRRLPQVPLHTVVLALRYHGPFTLAALERWTSSPFEDDLNSVALGSAAVLDLSLRRSFSSWEVSAAIENALDRRCAVGKTPQDVLGMPRTIRVGLAYRWGR